MKQGKMLCKGCGTEFEPHHYKQVFCTNQCRNDYFNKEKRQAIEHWKKCPLAQEERDAQEQN